MAQIDPVESVTDEPRKPSILDRVVSFLKEGRRNSSNDAGNLQQIHDLAVMNGAVCPMVFKESSGRLRWVMLSSNSYRDTDREIVSQAALEADVERADKEHNYGPLRWWHVGNPDPIAQTPGNGIDIGDCDFNAMHGRMLIESGTFRSERIGEAIKEHADILAGSIGFFHPLNQPDHEGVFNSIRRFERSLLPNARASNQLTALSVKGDRDMATVKEKWDEFVSLFGGDEVFAKSVVSRAEEKEGHAVSAGIATKEAEVVVKATPENDEPEPKAEAAVETPASESVEMTPEKFAEYIMPQIEQKMSDMIDAKMGAVSKETATKEAGLTSQITALETKLKEVEAVARTLSGDLPRGVKDGFRASQATTTVTAKEAPNTPKADPLDDFYGWITTSLGNQPAGAQPVQPPSA